MNIEEIALDPGQFAVRPPASQNMYDAGVIPNSYANLFKDVDYPAVYAMWAQDNGDT